MFKLSPAEYVVVYPRMTLMHPNDYAKLGREHFDSFYCIYGDRTTGQQVWPKVAYPHEPNWAADGTVTGFVSKALSLCPTQEHPNWEETLINGLTLNQMQRNGTLLVGTPPYDIKLNEETLVKMSSIGAHPALVTECVIPGTINPKTFVFYCNNQTCSGAVYRNADNSRIFVHSVPADCEEGLGEYFDVLPVQFRHCEQSVLVPAGDYVLGPANNVPYADEPVTPLTFDTPYRASVVIDEDGWLKGIHFTREL